MSKQQLRTNFQRAANSTRSYQTMRRNMFKRRRFRGKKKKQYAVNEVFGWESKNSLEKHNFRYIHSNMQSFIKTYNNLKNQYGGQQFLKISVDNAKQMNYDILKFLKQEEQDFAQQFKGNKEETLKFFQQSINKNIDQAYEKARNAAIRESFAAPNKRDINKLTDALKTMIQYWESPIFASVTENDKKMANLKNACKQIINGNYSSIDSFNMALLKGLGAVEEYAKQYVFNNAVDYISAQLTGTKAKKMEVLNYDNGEIKISSGVSGLADVILSINKPDIPQTEIGINIKSNQDAYHNAAREVSPFDVVPKDYQKEFNAWALFAQYVYWNGVALMSWHTDGQLSGSSELKAILDTTLQDINTNFLSAVYLLGLPSIFIANNMDAPDIMDFSNPDKIVKTAQLYLQKVTKNLFIVLHNKIYWTSEIYEKAINQYSNLGSARTISGDNLTWNRGLELYRAKAVWLKEHREELKSYSNDEIYSALQQVEEKTGLLNSLANTYLGGVWYFLRGTKTKQGFRIKLKYNIHR